MTTNNTEFTGFEVREELNRAFEEEGINPNYTLLGFDGFNKNNPAALTALCGQIAAHMKDGAEDEDGESHFDPLELKTYRNDEDHSDYIIRACLAYGGPSVDIELDNRRAIVTATNWGESIRVRFPADEDLPVINLLREIGGAF